MKGKVIFLDIDGVMTNYIDNSSYDFEIPKNYRISEMNLEVLKNFLIKNNIKIIFSTNWRRFSESGELSYWHYNGKKYKNQLPLLREYLKDFVLDGYEVTKERHLNKAEAICMFFEDNPDFKKKFDYCIVDDVDEGFSELCLDSNFFQTDRKFGLTEENTEKIKKILKIA